MVRKRKRNTSETLSQPIITSENSIKQPLSAIAAAKLKKLNANSEGLITDAHTVLSEPKLLLKDLDGKYESEYDSASEQGIEETIPVNLNFCTCQYSRNSDISDTPESLTIVLEKHGTASFVGCYFARVLKGAININGANLGTVPDVENVHQIFAPSTHPIIKIQGLDRINHVQLSSCEQPTPLMRISPLFAEIWATGKNQMRSFNLIRDSDSDQFQRPLIPDHVPEDWLHAVEAIANDSTNSVSLIIGPPRAGKSAFAKRLLNRYLTGHGKSAKAISEVAWLDLDPLKPEYTPHGQLSITIVRELNFGPAFTHPATTSSKHFMNETIAAFPLPMYDLSDFPEYLKTCISELIKIHRSFSANSSTHPPLIVNVSFAVCSVHQEILDFLIRALQPDHVVHFQFPQPTNSQFIEEYQIFSSLESKSRAIVHEIEAQSPPLPLLRTDAELRAMHTQSYFHLISDPSSQNSRTTLLPQWNPRPLTTLTPWTFTTAQLADRPLAMLAVLPLTSHCFPPSELHTYLNGTIVYILYTTDPEIISLGSAVFGTTTHRMQRTPDKPGVPQIPFITPDPETKIPWLPSPQHTRLLIPALLHSFSCSQEGNGSVNLLVPASHQSYSTTLKTLSAEEEGGILLVAGCCDVPEWAYVEDAYERYESKREALEKVLGKGVVSEQLVLKEMELNANGLGPWVEKDSVVQSWGYLGMSRRVRRFLE